MRKSILSRLCCAVLCCALMIGVMPAAFAAGTESSGKEIIGEWIWASTVADAGEDGAEKLIGRCAEMGVTDLYLLVKGTGGTLGYLKTQYPDNRSRTDRDVLQEVIDAAHPRGIRIHAWLCNMEDALYKTAHPDSGMWHYVRERDNNRINPYDEDYQAYMSSIVTELLTNYDIDGIHFDYIRYNHACNGWSETDKQNLAAMGADVEHLQQMIEAEFYNGEGETIFDAYNSGDSDALLLGQYRRDNVVNYAKVIIAAARAVKPKIIISAALQPDGALDPAFGNIHYGQSYEDAVELYDYICPMAYSGDFGKDAAWVSSVAEAAIKEGNKVVVGLQAYYPATSKNLMDEVNVVKSLRESAEYGEQTLGYVLFRTTQFGYAKVSYDTGKNEMTVKVINPGNAYEWVQIELQDGLTATSGEVVEGFADDTTVEIVEEGSIIKFSGTDMLAADSECTLRLKYEGTLNPDEAPALVRIYITNESRALNVYEDVTKPVDPTPVDPTPIIRPEHWSGASVAHPVVNPFRDVSKGSWYYDDVMYAFENGLMNGVSATRFAPEKALTRAELVTVLYRMADSPAVSADAARVFSDVSAGAWYAEAVGWGYETGIVKGYSNGTFAPDAEVTREEMITFLYRYYQMQGEDVSASAALNFSDAGNVNTFALDAMRWAVAEGILTGSAGRLLPKGQTTRAQMAAVLSRL